ncbi:MAG: hypothetical protein A2V77_12940 [Anaeromyxobacter sp. RBG_16_69_14]|nr:MAG: hypothetical protein A2V77_12940 [Anaeromyxobacter sp. RBG_16_69_14]HJW75707.1 nuclear transport factor 2 family protein [Thermoleophilia bacterium]
MTTDPKSIALAYIDACGRKDLDAVAPLLAQDMRFVGPGNTLTGSKPYLAVLRRLGPVWERSDVKKVFTDGADVCVIYDFVTPTAGSVPIVEWLRVAGGRIVSVTLFFDRVAFKPASDELARRAGS